MIARADVANKIAAYLHEEIPLSALVNWAEDAMNEEEFEKDNMEAIRDAVARIGLADVRAFGLTWEDCHLLLKKLGYTAEIRILAA